MAVEVTKEELFEKAERGEFTEWGFTNGDDYQYSLPVSKQGRRKVSGYEDVEDEMKAICTPEQWEGLDAEGRRKVEDQFIDIYRTKDIFPMTYFSEEGAEEEFINLRKRPVNGFDEVLRFPNGGGSVNNFFFPNLQKTFSQGTPSDVKPSMWDRFQDEHCLRRAIQVSYNTSKTIPMPSKLYGSLKLIGPVPTNFAPMNARELFSRFTPENGVVWDYCTGFGGRALGALSSPKNIKYVGTDPNTETMYNLHRMCEFMKETYEGDVTLGIPEVNYELRCMGAEDFDYPDNSIDFAFSSPPYFDLEIYSDEDTQSVNKYSGLDGWLEGFVRPTVMNLYRVLKPGSMYGVNIADFEHSGSTVHFVDKWREISLQCGFEPVKGISLGVTARPGSSLQKYGLVKKEVVYLFRKPWK